MKAKVFSIILIVLMLILTLLIMLKYIKKTPEENDLLDGNVIFTKEITDKIIAINYWYADTEIIINNKSDIQKISKELASLKLKKASPDEPKKEGSFSIELETVNNTIEFGLLSKIMYIDNEMYFIDNDVLSLIQGISEKYKVNN